MENRTNRITDKQKNGRKNKHTNVQTQKRTNRHTDKHACEKTKINKKKFGESKFVL